MRGYVAKRFVIPACGAATPDRPEPLSPWTAEANSSVNAFQWSLWPQGNQVHQICAWHTAFTQTCICIARVP